MEYSVGSDKYPHFTGAVYEGAYVNNKAHGFGILIFQDGEKYEGLVLCLSH